MHLWEERHKNGYDSGIGKDDTYLESKIKSELNLGELLLPRSDQKAQYHWPKLFDNFRLCNSCLLLSFILFTFHWQGAVQSCLFSFLFHFIVDLYLLKSIPF